MRFAEALARRPTGLATGRLLDGVRDFGAQNAVDDFKATSCGSRSRDGESCLRIIRPLVALFLWSACRPMTLHLRDFGLLVPRRSGRKCSAVWKRPVGLPP